MTPSAPSRASDPRASATGGSRAPLAGPAGVFASPIALSSSMALNMTARSVGVIRKAKENIRGTPADRGLQSSNRPLATS